MCVAGIVDDTYKCQKAAQAYPTVCRDDGGANCCEGGSCSKPFVHSLWRYTARSLVICACSYFSSRAAALQGNIFRSIGIPAEAAD